MPLPTPGEIWEDAQRRSRGGDVDTEAIKKLLTDIYKWRRTATREEIRWLQMVFPRAITGKIGLHIIRLGDKKHSGRSASILLEKIGR